MTWRQFMARRLAVPRMIRLVRRVLFWRYADYETEIWGYYDLHVQGEVYNDIAGIVPRV